MLFYTEKKYLVTQKKVGKKAKQAQFVVRKLAILVNKNLMGVV